ncbi:MAG: aldehyde ferredoxin oxidoreductase family protein [Sulfolobales archaeon]
MRCSQIEFFGYAGKIAYIDLSREKIESRELSEDEIKLFIGGIGLATKLLVENIPDPKINPFEPENPLIFMTGALTGTPVYGSSRFIVASKSPLTNAWGEAHIGGHWGPELKKAGFDGLVVVGKAKDPVYIYVENEKIEIRDARRFWGLDIYEASKEILKEVGDENAKISLIGPAGENLVRIATIAFDPIPYGPRMAGRTGMGSVMGSKNLKAIVVKGSGRIKLKDPSKVASVLNRLLPLIMSSPTAQIYSLYGTSGEVEEFYEYGDMPIKNFSEGVFEGYKKLTGEYFKEKGLMIGTYGCWACPVKCWKITKSESLTSFRFPEYETIASFGTMLKIDDPSYIVKFNEICNRYGLDTISTGNTIAWLFEIYERGLVNKDMLGGIEPKWGDGEAVIKLLHMIGRREGIGKILAEGCRRASQILGNDTERYCMHVKGVEMPMHDPRAFKGLGLQYATSNRGADHLYGLFMRIEQGQRMPDLRIYERVDRFSTKGKGWMVATMQIWSEIQESMGVCKFIDIPPAHIAGLYTYVTGIKTTVQDLLVVGKRIFTLKRLFNVANGISRKDDTLPRRILSEPLKEGGSKDQVVELDHMLEEYYKFMGWDNDGKPTREVIESLGLVEYAKKLALI